MAINIHDRTYHQLLRDILNNGEQTGDRTGTGTVSLFGAQCKYDLSKGFPLITTKRTWFKGILHELLFFLRGSTNAGELLDHNIHIWNEWTPAFKRGGQEEVQRCYSENPRHPSLELGPVYGKQWRAWEGREHDALYLDQLGEIIDRIRTKPTDRRLIVTAWDPLVIDKMALPPCHCFMQFKCYGGRLDLQLYQRSADVFLGVPFNIASYALLLMIVAALTNKMPGIFTHTFGDVHIYNNHLKQVAEQLGRESFPPPRVNIDYREQENPEDFLFEDFHLVGYNSHEAIKAPIAI